MTEAKQASALDYKSLKIVVPGNTPYLSEQEVKTANGKTAQEQKGFLEQCFLRHDGHTYSFRVVFQRHYNDTHSRIQVYQDTSDTAVVQVHFKRRVVSRVEFPGRDAAFNDSERAIGMAVVGKIMAAVHSDKRFAVIANLDLERTERELILKLFGC